MTSWYPRLGGAFKSVDAALSFCCKLSIASSPSSLTLYTCARNSTHRRCNTMASSRIAFRVRKVRRQEIKCTLSELNRICDAGATIEKNERNGGKDGKEIAAANADVGCENVGLMSSENYELADDFVDGSAGTDQCCPIGEVQDRAKTTKKDAGKRKRKSPGKPADSAPVVPVAVVAPLVAKNIKPVEEELESIPPMTVTNLFAPGVIAYAISHLKKCDPKLRAVIETQELPSFPKCSSAFSALVRSIVYQQLATKAAAAIFKRLVNLCGGDTLVTPSNILQLPAPELRNVGVSLRKASYLHDLARNFTVGELTDASISLMEDAKLMSTLTAVKGIGTWTVHMLMIFSLHRPDVLPVGDLVVRKGFQKLYNLPSLPSPTEMETIAASWRPYRSLGSWYMWRLISPIVPVVIPQEES